MNTKKYLFLTSAVIICMACPAFAETFPQDGNMLENKTYDNAATYANTGVYEGSVTANAEYTDNTYNVLAGWYFPAGAEMENSATQCLPGSFCPGISGIYYDPDNNQGIESCPANYSGSAAGSTASTDCYRSCATTDVAHSATVSGQMYYNGTSGDGVNACGAATCVNGWHVKSGTSAAQEDLIGLNNVNSSHVFVDNSGNTNGNVSNYGLSSSDHNAFAIDYEGVGVLRGHGRCSTQSGQGAWYSQSPTMFATLTDETGQEGAKYCYCGVDGYTPDGGTMESLASSWVLNYYINSDASNCASGCAENCASRLQSDSQDNITFRAAVLGSIPTNPDSCEANTINITWNDASAEDIAATGAATTVYEGDIKTPLKAVTKPGKTFVGWKFIKPQQ